MLNKQYLYKGSHPYIKGKVGKVIVIIENSTFVEFLYGEEVYRVSTENLYGPHTGLRSTDSVS